MEGVIAEIRLFGGNFAPRGWAFCQGQIFSIVQNTALFSLLGTTYGGNGQTTFALPDLRGRVAVGTGQGPGLSGKDLGEQSGSESVTLITSEMPAHTHAMQVHNDTTAMAVTATGNFMNSKTESGESIVSTGGAPMVSANGLSVGITGGSQPHSNLQPYLGLNFIICIEGIYPSRN